MEDNHAHIPFPRERTDCTIVRTGGEPEEGLLLNVKTNTLMKDYNWTNALSTCVVFNGMSWLQVLDLTTHFGIRRPTSKHPLLQSPDFSSGWCLNPPLLTAFYDSRLNFLCDGNLVQNGEKMTLKSKVSGTAVCVNTALFSTSVFGVKKSHNKPKWPPLLSSKAANVVGPRELYWKCAFCLSAPNKMIFGCS